MWNKHDWLPQNFVSEHVWGVLAEVISQVFTSVPDLISAFRMTGHKFPQKHSAKVPIGITIRTPGSFVHIVLINYMNYVFCTNLIMNKRTVCMSFIL